MKLAYLPVVLIAFTNSYGQPVHPVEPATKGNRIDLAIVNQAGAIPAEGIEVRAVQYPQEITFKSRVESIGSVPPQGERTATFVFDVARPTKLDKNSQDTLKFLITDKSGLMSEKSIILGYTLPSTFALEQNFPNPFNPSTTIYYELPADSRVKLQIYNVLGQLVATLVDENRPAGYHEARFDATALPSGVYFYRLRAASLTNSSFTSVKKMMLLK